jgi:hypothetical protein
MLKHLIFYLGLISEQWTQNSIISYSRILWSTRPNLLHLALNLIWFLIILLLFSFKFIFIWTFLLLYLFICIFLQRCLVFFNNLFIFFYVFIDDSQPLIALLILNHRIHLLLLNRGVLWIFSTFNCLCH